MFCKNCHKFNMTEKCIYCGFHNDGKLVKKKTQPKQTNSPEVENTSVEHLPETPSIETPSKAKLLKILNIVAISLFGAFVLFQFLLVLRLNAAELGSVAIGYLAQIFLGAAVVPCILYLYNKKYKEKFTEKTHMIITIVCLVFSAFLALSAIFNLTTNFSRIVMMTLINM